MRWSDMPDQLKAVVADRLHQTRREYARRITHEFYVANDWKPAQLEQARNELAAIDAALTALGLG